MTHPAHPNSASLLTRADYDQYRAHLEELRRVRDRDLPELLRDARGFVASDAEGAVSGTSAPIRPNAVTTPRTVIGFMQREYPQFLPRMRIDANGEAFGHASNGALEEAVPQT